MSAPVVVTVLAAVVGGGLLLLLRAVAQAKRSAIADARALIADPSRLEDSALFFGLASRGKAQGRGNGWLVLSNDKLAFVRWMPRMTIEIERTAIEKVSTTRTHLGKWIGRDLLHVRFVGADGKSDEVAWYVRELPHWLRALEG